MVRCSLVPDAARYSLVSGIIVTKMDEKIVAFELKNPRKTFPIDRKKFYDSQIEVYKKKGKPELGVEIVDICIFNEHGELYVQKRSSYKRHNPNLQDKSIGGHVKYGDPLDYTVMTETIQELKVPSVVLRNDKDFAKAYDLLADYLDTAAIIKYVDGRILKLIKIIDGEEIRIGNRKNIYFGVYHGRVKTVDREAKGVLTYSLSDLEEEIQQFPKLFTDDLKVILKMYKPQMEAFVREVKVMG